jgi:hypothetical protein
VKGEKKMQNKILVGILITSMILLSSFVLADDFEGWDEIRPALKDGDGSEFVREVGIPDDYFKGTTELEALQAAVNWVATEYDYVADDGEVWTSSDQMYGPLEGDCEDWAILLTALLRFHTQYNDGQTIGPDKVWVAINLVTEPGVGVVAAHAWVGYRLDKGGKIHIEPGLTGLYRGKPNGMLNFNDGWVKGGGFWLAGPKNK